MNYSSQHSVQFILATMDSFLKKLERTYKIVTMIWSNKLIFYTHKPNKNQETNHLTYQKTCLFAPEKILRLEAKKLQAEMSEMQSEARGVILSKCTCKKARWYDNDMKLYIYIHIKYVIVIHSFKCWGILSHKAGKMKRQVQYVELERQKHTLSQN